MKIFAMLLVELFGSFIVILSIVYIYYKYVIFSFWRKRDVFYIEPVVPVGNAAPFVTGKTTIGVFFQDIYMKYKNHRVFGIYAFFKPILVITDLELIRTVLTKEFASFHDRGVFHNKKTDPLMDNLFCMPGKRWRNMRVKLTPTFTSGKIKQMFSILKENSEIFVKYLESKVQMRNSEVEMKDMFARYSMDVIMSTAFGIKSNCIEDPNSEFRTWGKKVFDGKAIWFALFLFTPQIMNFFSIPLSDRRVSKFFMKVFRENVEYRQTHNIVRHDFMNLLIQLMENDYVELDDDKMATNESPTISKLTMTEATAQSYIFFLAGFETSSTTATYTLYELAQHQDIQDKVRKEIDEMLTKHGGLTYDAVNEMAYLHKVVNEAMRKYPSVPFLNRACTQEIDLPTTNVRVPKGVMVVIPVLGLHRDPSIYPDPDKFDPERFNADKVAERHLYAYLPFGEGPRNCIGSRFGYMQTKIGLVSLLSKFKFKLHPKTPIPLIFDERAATLTAKGGVHFIIELR